MNLEPRDVKTPLDVPSGARDDYVQNFLTMTSGSGNMLLFAGDQKVEHLNDDFFGPGVHPDDNDPEHLFKIAQRARIGVFASQLGLIARYAVDYRDVPYMIKINSKSPLVGTDQRDPLSGLWLSVPQVVDFKKNSGLNITSIGYTIYLGSEHEPQLFTEAAQAIYQAHQHGLLAVLWVYPRGKAVKDESDPHLIAGACGTAACLGADFVKVNYPKKEGVDSAEAFKESVLAAGRTGVVCAGGAGDDVEAFLKRLHDQINISGAKGTATGRNIHQKSLDDAVRMCDAMAAVVMDGKSVKEALEIRG